MNTDQIMKKLYDLGSHSQKDLDGMARFGINTENCWCVSTPNTLKLAKEIKKDSNAQERHRLALELWETDIREARILASFIDEPALVTEKQMESWVKDFNSWDLCDQVCMKLFSYTDLAWKKALEWSKREKEFEKRAGFVLMATLPMRNKKAPDANFYPFFKRIKQEAKDERNFVKKAVNWALRQLGKSKSKGLYELALKTADEIIEEANTKIQIANSKVISNSKLENSKIQSKIETRNSEIAGLKAALWIAKDAKRELTTTPYVLKKFGT